MAYNIVNINSADAYPYGPDGPQVLPANYFDSSAPGNKPPPNSAAKISPFQAQYMSASDPGGRYDAQQGLWIFSGNPMGSPAVFQDPNDKGMLADMPGLGVLGMAAGAYGLSGISADSPFSGLADYFKGAGGDASWGVNPQDAFGAGSGYGSPLSDATLAGTQFENGVLTGAGAGINPGGFDGPLGDNPNASGNPMAGSPGSVGLPPGAGTAASALSKLLGIDEGTLKLLGIAGSTGLGLLGSDSARSTANSLSDKYLALGAPSRARYEASFQPGFSMANEPGYADALDASSNSVLRKLSATNGANPFGTPGGLIEANKYVTANTALPQLNTYRSQNATTGQLGTNIAGTLAPQQIAASGGALNTLGSGLANVTNPPQSLAELIQAFKTGMGSGSALSKNIFGVT